MGAAAKRKAHHFVGQVIDHVGAKALRVWAFDDKCAYHATPVSVDDFPVGAVVECTMYERDGFVESLCRASERAIKEHRRDLVMPTA